MTTQFEQQVGDNIAGLRQDEDFAQESLRWLEKSAKHSYSYNFRWLGRPIIQYPQDIVAMQELIWDLEPDLVIEIGIAHGGSLILHASILELIGGEGKVLGVDIDIRPDNRAAIEGHRMFKRIEMIEGSSVDETIALQVADRAADCGKVLLILDSNHTHEHVLRELKLYSPLVTAGSYLVVYDTLVEDMPDEMFIGRPWGKGDNPKTAVHEFLQRNDRFEIDQHLQAKLGITVAPDGYLRCVRD